MTLPDPDQLRAILPPVILAVAILLPAKRSQWRGSVFVLDAGGALAFGGAFLWSFVRLGGGIAWPPAGATGKLAWCVVAAMATGMIESPIWKRPVLAPALRLPVVGLLAVWLAPSPGDAAVTAGTGAVVFLSWWSVKELAARHPGIVLVALAATAAATGLLMQGAGAPLPAGLALTLAGALVLAAPVTASTPRLAAGRGALAPVVVGLAGIWLAGWREAAGPPSPAAFLLLALAPQAPWVARLPALRRRSPRIAALAGLASSFVLAGIALLAAAAWS